MRIAITGAGGQLGRALNQQLGNSVHGFSRVEVDVTDIDSLRKVMSRVRPHVIINCAAYTAVDKAEQHPAECFACNAGGLENLARLCSDSKTRLVQISTDYVFGGDLERRTPYTEGDAAAALSTYGRSKLLGEKHAQNAHGSLIVRTCGLYGSSSSENFVNSILRLARTVPRIRVVSDQCCTPSYVQDIAKSVMFLVDYGAVGVFHVVNEGSTTWFDFANEIVKFFGIQVELVAVSSAEYGASAVRPAYSVLDTSKYQAAGGPPLTDCLEALSRYLAQRK